MIEFRRLTDEADARYADAIALYKESFPIHEQRMPESQAAILRDGAYHFDLIYDGGEWMGLMLWWEAETFLYVEHFCILPAARNRGCGGRALMHLAKRARRCSSRSTRRWTKSPFGARPSTSAAAIAPTFIPTSIRPIARAFPATSWWSCPGRRS